jgi:hypothetical protein
MKAQEITTAVAGLIGVGAAVVASLLIGLLLTSPTSIAGAMDGSAGPFQAVARVLFESLAHLVRLL